MEVKARNLRVILTPGWFATVVVHARKMPMTDRKLYVQKKPNFSAAKISRFLEVRLTFFGWFPKDYVLEYLHFRPLTEEGIET